ncbi:MAG TPA: hypothetical protein VMB78_12165, partial [Dissulfurispiraceae bacterium]|nr:hypothetical protein [Dissulfurispiraceae bacterium]
MFTKKILLPLKLRQDILSVPRLGKLVWDFLFSLYFAVALLLPVSALAAAQADLKGTVSNQTSQNEVVPISVKGAGNDMLQFKSGNHILVFLPNKAYLAAMDHALSVQFLGTKGVMPTSDMKGASKESSAKTSPLNKVVYKNLWNDISLTYESTKDGVTESTYYIAPGADVSKIRLKYNVPIEAQKDG